MNYYNTLLKGQCRGWRGPPGRGILQPGRHHLPGAEKRNNWYHKIRSLCGSSHYATIIDGAKFVCLNFICFEICLIVS